jgi:iron complex outermembrane receptor protein
MIRRTSFITFCLTLVASAGLPGRAQDTAPLAADETTVQLDRYVVHSVPAPSANSVAGAPEIRFQSPNASVLNAIAQLPGVNISQGDPFGGDDWSTRIVIRGFDTDQLGYTVDGLPIGQTGYGGGTKPNRFIDLENLASVLVSQGAGDVTSPSTQALGGTLAYKTVNPSPHAGGFVKFTTGSFDLSRVFARVDSGTFGTDQSAYLSFSRSTYNRWIGSGSNGRTDRLHLDGKWLAAAGHATFATSVHVDRIAPEINYQGISKADFATNPNWDRLTWNWTGDPMIDQNYAETWTTERTNIAIDTRMDVKLSNDFALAVHPYFHHQQGRGGWLPPYEVRRYDLAGNPSSVSNYTPADKAGTILFKDAAGADILPFNPATGTAAANPADIRTYTWLTDAQRDAAKSISSRRYSRYEMDRYGLVSDLVWQTADNTLQLGMWNEIQDRQRSRTWHSVLDPRVAWAYDETAYVTTFDWDYRTVTNQLYAKDAFKFGGFTLTAGLKYYLVSLEAQQKLLNANGRFSPKAETDSDSPLLPSLGVQYQLSPESELFASYSRNYKAVSDGVLEIVDTGRDPATAKGEKSGNIDFGYRYVGKRNIGFSATGYYAEYTDKLLYITDVPSKVYDAVGTGAYVNIGGIETYGAEFAANCRLGGGFTVTGAYSYNRAEYTKTVDVISAGKRVVDMPEHLLSLSLAYRQGGFDAGLAGKYTSKRYGTFSNDEYAGAYTLFDGYVGYTRDFAGNAFIKSLTLSLNVTNLLDKSYLANTSINDLGSTPKTGPSLYLIGPPRALSFTVALGF